jgi:hypothetical protein
MLFAILDLGPSAPFVGVLIVGLALASVVASVAVFVLPSKGEGQPHSRGRKELVWILVWVVIFLLWGSSSGHGGPNPAGGITGYTHAGLFHYLTVSSHQPRVGSEWSHGFSPHIWPLVGTVALSAVALIVGAVATRKWRKAAKPKVAPDCGGITAF